jgi:hypothetical protein
MSDTFEPAVDTEDMAEDKYAPVADEYSKGDWDEDAPIKVEDLDDGAGDRPQE